jgi:AraC-like DNA-binding protein
MERAAELLRDSNMSMSEIASAVGFSGQSRFTSAFKAHFGMTPTEYKKPTFVFQKKSRQKKTL